MPETLTQKMARYQLAIAAGDAAAAQRIAAERIAPPAPRPNPRVATVATYPEWPNVREADYQRLRSEVQRLESRNRALTGELQQRGAVVADLERRLTQALAKIEALEQNIENA